jgi:hypothetical protein
MQDEKIFYDGGIPLKVFYASYGFFWYVLFGWNIGLLTSWLTIPSSPQPT